MLRCRRPVAALPLPGSARPGPTQAASISPAAPRVHTPGSGHVAYLAADPNQNQAFSEPGTA